MEYEISIQAILIGMLKKWKLMLASFIVVLAIAVGFNVFSAKKAADKINSETRAAESGESVNEKTVTTSSKEVLTVSQLNSRIKRLQDNITYYEKMRLSPKIKGDLNSIYCYCRRYYISKSGADDKQVESLAESIAGALGQYIQTDEFKGKLGDVKDVVDMAYLGDVIATDRESATINIKVQYLDRESAQKLMAIVEPVLVEKMDEYKTSLGAYEYSLMQSAEYTFADETLIKQKETYDISLAKAKTDLDALVNLARTVENENEIGKVENTAESNGNVTRPKVTLLSQLSKRKIAISVLLAIIAALAVGFVYVAMISRRILSAYDVSDLSGRDILDVRCKGTPSFIERFQIKHFGNDNISLSLAKIKKGLHQGNKVLLDIVGSVDREEYLENVSEAFKQDEIDIIKSWDYNNRADFIAECNSGDISVLIVNLEEASKTEFMNTMDDYSKIGVNLAGSFVEI